MKAVNGSTYESLCSLIAAGEFESGESLQELKLANLIGVSRTPVREALRRLAAEGIVELEPNKGAQLAQISDANASEIFEVRCLLEPYATGRAALHAENWLIDKLKDLAAEMEAVVDAGRENLDNLVLLNQEFHDLILNASKSRMVVEALNNVMRRPLIQRTFHRYSDQQLNRSQKHHRELIEAISLRNAPWAESVMRSHLEAARSIYTQVPG